jgi:hypothetical protein
MAERIFTRHQCGHRAPVDVETLPGHLDPGARLHADQRRRGPFLQVECPACLDPRRNYPFRLEKSGYRFAPLTDRNAVDEWKRAQANRAEVLKRAVKYVREWRRLLEWEAGRDPERLARRRETFVVELERLATAAGNTSAVFWSGARFSDVVDGVEGEEEAGGNA